MKRNGQVAAREYHKAFVLEGTVKDHKNVRRAGATTKI
jgi:hypothetical protein